MFRRKKFGYMLLLVLAVILILPQATLWPQDTQEKEEKEKPDELFNLSLEELMNVKITTAGKTPEEIRDIPASVVVITRDDIEKYGYQSLAEVLENIPGLYYTNDYFMENFGVRGYWTADSLRNLIILVNDIEQTEHLNSMNPLELINIPVEAIDRIEVVRGPMSVMYGTGAFFGVINIFTNKTDIYDGGPVSLVSSSVGSEKTKKVTLRVSDISDDGDLQYTLNASYFDTDGLDVPYEKLGAVGHPVPTTKGQLDNTEKYFNFSGLFKGFSFDASYSETQNGSLFLLPPLSDGTRMDWRKVNVFFGYEREFSDTVRAEAKFGYFLNTWTFDYDFLMDNLYGRQHNQSSGYKAELNMFLDPSSNLSITAGVNYYKIMDIISEYTVPFFGFNLIHHTLADGSSKITQSIYGQVNYTLSDRFKIVAGARLEQVPEYTLQKVVGDFETSTNSTTELSYSHTKAEFIPRVALIFQPNEDQALKFLYGKAINHPSFFQNSQNYISGNYQPPTLVPEYIQTLELNYIATLSSKFTVSLSLFRNMLNKLIYRTLYFGEGSVTSYFANVGKMTTNGVELTIQAAPTEDFFLEFSGTYQHTREKPRIGADGTDVPVPEDPGYSPKFLGYIKASYFFNDNISLAVTGNYVGEMEAYYDDTLGPPTRIGDPVDGYFLLGANLRIRKLFDTGLFLNLRGSNLLDQEIRYPTTSNNSNFAKKGTIGRGISFLLTLGWKF